MKLSIFFIFFTCSVLSQTYVSDYDLVGKFSLFPDEEKDNSFLNVSNIDTVNLENNNDLGVFLGSIQAYSNNDYCYLELTIRKSNLTSFLPKDRTTRCLIDYQNKIVFDLSSGKKHEFSFALDEEHSSWDILDSIFFRQDSISRVSFHLENEICEIETRKGIPAMVRATVLDSRNDWGVSKLRTADKQITLINYEAIDFNFQSILKEAEEVCEKSTEQKSLAFL